MLGGRLKAACHILGLAYNITYAKEPNDHGCCPNCRLNLMYAVQLCELLVFGLSQTMSCSLFLLVSLEWVPG